MCVLKMSTFAIKYLRFIEIVRKIFYDFMYDGVDLSSRIVKLVSKHLQTSIHALSKSAQLTLQYILERSVMEGNTTPEFM